MHTFGDKLPVYLRWRVELRRSENSWDVALLWDTMQSLHREHASAKLGIDSKSHQAVGICIGQRAEVDEIVKRGREGKGRALYIRRRLDNVNL